MSFFVQQAAFCSSMHNHVFMCLISSFDCLIVSFRLAGQRSQIKRRQFTHYLVCMGCGNPVRQHFLCKQTKQYNALCRQKQSHSLLTTVFTLSQIFAIT